MLKPSRSEAAASTTACVVEVNGGPAVQVACLLSSSIGENYKIELWAKTGDEDSSGGHGDNKWDWKPCQTSGLFLCQNVDASWGNKKTILETGNLEAVQITFVAHGGS